MKAIFLGTNGWYTTATGNTPCVLIDTNDCYIVFDAGNGLHKLDTYITQEKPIYLFISHFHIDHVSGFHNLAKFHFKQPINIYVGEGRKNDFSTLVNPPFTIGYLPSIKNVNNLKVTINFFELSEVGITHPINAKAVRLHHAYGNHGYRLELEGKIIAYSGDCGFTEKIIELAKDADLLICECANKKTETPDIWGHLDPYLVADIAKQANAKQVILTHFGANEYKTIQERTWAQNEAKKIFPSVIAATDGMELLL